MFHTAGTRRSSLPIGSRRPVAGLKRTKSRMRCSSGERPVIIVVHKSGDRGGCSVTSTPPLPSRSRRARFGILPAAISFFIGLIKDTSIAYIVGLHELTKTSQLVTMSEPSNTFEIYLIAGVIYFCICFSLSRVGLRLEDRYKRSGVFADRVGV